MTDVVTVAYVGQDWIEGFSTHVILRNFHEFAEALGRVPGVRTLRATTMEDVLSADAVLLFHHTHVGFQNYECSLYFRLIEDVVSAWPTLKQTKLLWHVEPIVHYFSKVSKISTLYADVILWSSGDIVHFRDQVMCEDAWPRDEDPNSIKYGEQVWRPCYDLRSCQFCPAGRVTRSGMQLRRCLADVCHVPTFTVYSVGNPCFLSTFDASKKCNAISAPLNVDFHDRSRQYAGRLRKLTPMCDRVAQVTQLYGNLPVEVHCYGTGWREIRDTLPVNFVIKGKAMDSRPYKDYAYVLEVVESDRREHLNDIMWNSDRLSWALGHGCHLVTDMSWTHTRYASTRSHEWLAAAITSTGVLPSHDVDAIERDRSSMNHDVVAARFACDVLKGVVK